MTLKEIGEQAYKNADDKGFWHNYRDINSAIFEVYTNDYYENLEKQLNILMINNILMHVVTELGEASEALKKNNLGIFNDVIPEFDSMNDEQFKTIFESTIKDTFSDELADPIILILGICKHYEIDIEQSIKLKMRYNSLREIKHGKEF